jgi:hypothetical protein
MKTQMLSQLFTNLIGVWATVYPHDPVVAQFDQNPDSLADEKTRENYVKYFIESLAGVALPDPYKEIFEVAVQVYDEYKALTAPPVPVPEVIHAAAPETVQDSPESPVPASQVDNAPHALIVAIMGLIRDFYSVK